MKMGIAVEGRTLCTTYRRGSKEVGAAIDTRTVKTL